METEEEFTERCRENAAAIFVRTMKEGVWGSYCLAELPEKERAFWIREFWETGREPSRSNRRRLAQTEARNQSTDEPASSS